MDNIGARRLHTILERILEEISFSAPEQVRGNGAHLACLIPDNGAACIHTTCLGALSADSTCFLGRGLSGQAEGHIRCWSPE